MRQKQFVVEHRGGTLTKDTHYQIILRGYKCVENVLLINSTQVDERLITAIKTVNKWT